MEKRKTHRVSVIATGFEEEWNMFFGDLEEAYREGWTVEGGDILTVHEYGVCEKTFPSLKAAKKFVAHCCGISPEKVGEITWFRYDDLPEEDWRSRKFDFPDGVRWVIKEI